MKMHLIGQSDHGVPVIDGAFICHMMDTYGLAVADYAQMCRTHGLGWSMSGFIAEGIRRGWTLQQIANKLLDNKPAELPEAVVYNLITLVHRKEQAQ